MGGYGNRSPTATETRDRSPNRNSSRQLRIFVSLSFSFSLSLSAHTPAWVRSELQLRKRVGAMATAACQRRRHMQRAHPTQRMLGKPRHPFTMSTPHNNKRHCVTSPHTPKSVTQPRAQPRPPFYPTLTHMPCSQPPPIQVAVLFPTVRRARGTSAIQRAGGLSRTAGPCLPWHPGQTPMRISNATALNTTNS